MANNQVTVRFESTVETNESDRISYIQVFPFVEVDPTEPINTEIEYFVVRNGKYTRTYSPSSEDKLYKRNYILSEDIDYYELTEDGYEVIDEDRYYEFGLDFYFLHEVFLMSGPVEIFATLDVIHSERVEETGRVVIEAHPTREEMTNYEKYPLYFNETGDFDIELYTLNSEFGNQIALQSPYISDLVYNYVTTTDRNVIIYVENVTNYQDQARNRGAYFHCSKVDIEENNTRVEWQEIILGTHSHTNMQVLEDLSELALALPKEASNLVLNPDGSFSLTPVVNSNTLPDLPAEIQEKLAELTKYKDINEPTDSEWHHLDASFDELENGDHNTSIVGNCRSLYRYLLRSGKNLYLTENFELSYNAEDSKDDTWLSLDTYNVNFNYIETVEGVENVKLYNSSKTLLALGIELSSNLLENDDVFLLYEGKVLSDHQYDIINRDGKSLGILFVNTGEFDGVKNLTVLIVRNSKNIPGYHANLINAINSGKVDLVDINNKLAKLYVESEFAKKPSIPKVYLSTDNSGNLVWDNKFLPSQTFYANTKRFDKSSLDLIKVEKDGIECVRIEFEDAYYNVKNDFPILTVNDFFVFNAMPDINESGKNLVYYLPVNPDEGQYDFELEDGEFRNVTLVLVRNSSGEITDELARNYVTKEDAIAILSHGKIELKDFINKTEALKFSRIGHVHNQYALKEHNHDSRYANFHHTHPEIVVSVLAALNREDLNVTVDSLLKDINDSNKAQLENFVDELGVVDGKFSDENVVVDTAVSDSLIAKVKDAVGECDYNEGDTLYLKDLLELVLILFEYDKVKDTQVLLDADLPVRLVNGPVGGIATAKRYKAGDNLQNILRDILNPYISVEDMERLLTPTVENSEIKWYIVESESLREIDINKAPYSGVSQLVFSIDLNNNTNNHCTETIIANGMETVLKTIVEAVEVADIPTVKSEYKTKDGQDTYVYSYGFDFSNDYDNVSLDKIDILFKSNLVDSKIYDNYGISSSILNQNNERLSLTEKITIEYPDYFYGGVDAHEMIEENIKYHLNQAASTDGDEYLRYDTGKDIIFKVDTHVTPVIVVAVEASLITSEDVIIYDTFTRTDITRFFNEISDDIELFGNRKYVVKYYECLYYDEEDTDSELSIRLCIPSLHR